MIEFQAHHSSSAGNLYSLADEGSTLAIECGVPIGEMRRALGFRLSSLDALLLSHHHQDHARAAAEVMRAGVNVYASARTLAALGVNGHRSIPLEPRKAIDIGPWTVLAFDVRHDADGALGFLVQGPSGDRLLYACDTGYVPYRFRGLTHVCIEANYSAEILRRRVDRGALAPEQQARVLRHHMSLERAIEMLGANDLSRVREIWLLHLSDDNSDEAAFRMAVAEATGKPVIVAPRRT